MKTCIILLISAVLFLSQCMQEGSTNKLVSKTKDFRQFAGSEACRNCHSAIYENHLQTFHHHTSAIATEKTLLGVNDNTGHSFYFDPVTYISIEKENGRFYQAVYKKGVKKLSRPFDFVIGSGKRGQTSLYWYNNNLFQLPLTYFTATHEWTNSPGYPDRVVFNRPITSRCLECHSTYFQVTNNPDSALNTFSKTNFILGVECEKCHGPAAAHVDYQQKNPGDSVAHFIISPGKMSRKQDLDFCRSCHGGRLSKTAPSFTFENGDKLSDYFKLDTASVPESEMDVHGNQYGKLSGSKCFTGSNMTCMSCHTIHVNENNNKIGFAEKCLTCHSGISSEKCKLSPKLSPVFLKNNCIDCHMPELPSRAIMVLRQGESIPTSATMRTHFITVYPEETKKILASVKVIKGPKK